MSLPEAADTVSVSVVVNGRLSSLVIESRRTLAEVIREDLGLTGTHLGCEHGVCGACTVLMDGDPVRSCLVLAVQASGLAVETIESLAEDGGFGPIQQAMWENHSFQCAFCAPGFLMTTKALLALNPHPTKDEIREELSGNLCRCTGYASIIAGVEAAIISSLASIADTATAASGATVVEIAIAETAMTASGATVAEIAIAETAIAETATVADASESEAHRG